ncbi:MAG: DUF4169 family protein [Pseudomonadota bacterium]
MTTPINLNKARKARAKVAKEQSAAENRAKFGRTKAEKMASKKIKDAVKTSLDGKKLTPD